MASKLPGHKFSRSNLFGKVQDVASGAATIKGLYDAGRTLYNVGRTVAPYVARAAAII